MNTQTKTEHTPTPWILDETWMLVKGPGNEEVCAIHSGTPDTGRQNRHVAHENAALICRAVNSHHALLEALKYVKQIADQHGGDHFGYGEFINEVNAAIALAD